MKEVYLYKKLQKGNIRCQNCAHYCIIGLDQRGICGVRENIDGKLYALNYGKVIACHIDPIEKKPFFHFLPGSHSLSIATAGCNFSCLNCQNWNISQGFKEAKEIPGENLPPEEIVKIALKNKLPSISYTYTEPTIFLEYALDAMKLARKAGLKNIWVSNGFMSKESAKLAIPYLDAINIDIKSFSENFYKEVCGARLQPVLDSAKLMKKSGIWLEITTLAIPMLSDGEEYKSSSSPTELPKEAKVRKRIESSFDFAAARDNEEMFRNIAKFIKTELGIETPWHISQFSGAISWKLQHLPETPVEILETAYKIGKETGLKYVYTGNVPGLSSEDTLCPKCQTLAINRFGYSVKRYDKNGKCPKCGENLDLILK